MSVTGGISKLRVLSSPRYTPNLPGYQWTLLDWVGWKWVETSRVYLVFWILINVIEHLSGGWGGIRTHGELTPSPVFKTGAFNRSATHPSIPLVLQIPGSSSLAYAALRVGIRALSLNVV